MRVDTSMTRARGRAWMVWLRGVRKSSRRVRTRYLLLLSRSASCMRAFSAGFVLWDATHLTPPWDGWNSWLVSMNMEEDKSTKSLCCAVPLCGRE